MKETITLSINPSYLCNLRCNFCYLSDEQLGNVKAIDNQVLFERLEEISTNRQIEHVDLYGGEIALLKTPYLQTLLDTIRFFYKGEISIISNLTVVHPLFLEDGIDLSVSWDYFAREHHEKVFQNMLDLKKDFHLLILSSDKLVNLKDEELNEFIQKLSQLPHLVSVEIKPFSNNQFHSQEVSYLDYERWIQRWIDRCQSFPFEFINKKKIEASLRREYSSWSDEHLYIVPSGKFAVLEFDELNREFFLELNGFNEYTAWIEKEKFSVMNNKFCGNCKYLGSCLSEHLQPIYDETKSCNGFKNLLSWYESERL